MKKSIIILLLLVAACMTGCNTNSDTQTETVTNERAITGQGPIITFKENKMELDTITTTEGKQCVFHYTNTGNEPLVLSSVVSSCGCIKGEWSKDPLMPGLSDSIIVTVKTVQLGSLMKAVVVKSNATNDPAATLRMFGYVIE